MFILIRHDDVKGINTKFDDVLKVLFETGKDAKNEAVRLATLNLGTRYDMFEIIPRGTVVVDPPVIPPPAWTDL